MNGLNRAFRDGAERFGVPLSWIMAICWMEVAHGWYDEPPEWFDANATLRPMNINVEHRSRLFTRPDTERTRENVMAGAFFLSRLRDRTHPMTLRRAATLYTDTGCTTVSDDGARMAEIHRRKYDEGRLVPR